MVIISILLSFSVVQTKIARFATNKINDKYGTAIFVDKVDLSSLRNIKLKEVLIKDHHNDTLIYVEKISTSILNYRNLLKSNLQFGKIKMSNGGLFMKTYKEETTNNLTVFAKKFETDTVKSVHPFQLTSDEVQLKNIDFDLVDENKKSTPIVFYHGITGVMDNFKIYRSDVSGDVFNLQLIEDHNIHVQNFTTEFLYSDTKMEFYNTILETESSHIEADIAFNYKQGDLSDFTNKVQIDATFKKADIALTDLKKFYNEFGKNDNIHFTAKANGTLNNFELKEVVLTSDRSSSFSGNLKMNDVFGKKNFSLNANIHHFTSNYDHLKNLLPNLLGTKIPTSIEKIGNFTSKGKLILTKSSVNANLDTHSEIGEAITDIQITNINNIDFAEYKGDIELKDVNLGKLANDSLIGKISMIGKINGKGFTLENVNTEVEGLITQHQYKGYTYHNIEISGVLKDKHFNGKLDVDQPDLQLEFIGLADLSKKKYKFDFNADVTYADFNALNLFKRDSTSILKGKIDIDFTGSNLDDLVGNLSFKNATYINQKDIYYFKDFAITSSIKDSIREVKINSPDIISGSVKGKFKYDELPKITKNALGSLFINYQKEKVSAGQYVDFNFNIYNKIIDVFFPEVKIGSNTYIRGSMIADDDKFEVTLKSPKITAFDNVIDNIRLQVDNKNPIYNTLLSIDQVDTKYYDVADVNLVNVTLNDTLFIQTDFVGGKEKNEHFDLSFYHTINANNQSVFGIKKSNFTIKDNDWEINPKNNKQNKIVFDNSYKTFAIDNVSLVSGYQFIDLAGLINGEDDRYIDLRLENVNLNAITPSIDSVAINGKVNGNFSLKVMEGKTMPFADVRVNYFNINNDYYGDLSLKAKRGEQNNDYEFSATLLNSDLKTLVANGKVNFNSSEPQINANLALDRFKIKAFSPLGKNVISKIRGLASGTAIFSGDLSNPQINGEIQLLDAGLELPYLNVDYDFIGETTVKLADNTFDFQTVTLEDVAMKTRGELTGTIRHRNFKTWFLDLALQTDRLLVLNTKESDEALYYGTGLLSGNTTLKGPTDNLVIDVRGKTLKGTEFIIPLSYVSSVNSSRLIHFEDPNTIEDEYQKRGDVIFDELKGLDLNFNLEVTKDAVAEVVIDKVTGSLLRGSGDGDLSLSIDTNGKFEMYGSLLIDNGEYQFKNLINKDFEVVRGGTIVWNGNPTDAILSLEAINYTKANPSVLLTEISSSRKIDVELITYITGSLSHADFNFDIKIPNASSMVASELEFILNKEDDKLTQFFSVLATGSFMNLDQKNNAAFNGNAAIAGTLAEKASGFLSQILKTGNDNLQVGVTYDAAASNSVENVITDDQLGILVSGKIADKVTVNGKVGVPVGANTNSNVIGEVEVVFPLNQAETLQGKVYNRQNEIQFDVIDGEGYTQGAGISYRFDFDNTDEFLRKLGFKKSKEEKKLAAKKRDSIKKLKKQERQEKNQ